MRRLKVALVGATGAVGQEVLRLLRVRGFPVASDPVLVASERSAGTRVSWGGRDVTVRELSDDLFEGVDLALFSAGAEQSRTFAPAAVRAGAVVVDNSSAWRMDPDVPLVVTEVNPRAVHRRPLGIVANPNCTTMVLMVAVKPLHDAFGLEQMVVSTYQSVGGEGHSGIAELVGQMHTLVKDVDGLVHRGAQAEASVSPERFPRPVAFNVVPQCGALEHDGYTVEEHKLIAESRKILELPELGVSPTNVRVPVVVGHSLSARLTFAAPVDLERAVRVLDAAPGLVVADGAGGDGKLFSYPTALACAGREEVLVGRIRQDPADRSSLNLFVSGDNLLKGAALNAVQIAELIGAEPSWADDSFHAADPYVPRAPDTTRG